VSGSGQRRARAGAPPIIAVSGVSGVGKTRLLARLIPALVARGLRVGALKHTSHDHPFDRRGKDTEVLRRSGAIAAAIDGPRGLAYFGPPARSVSALARLLPPVDLVVAEGFKHEPLPRVEVHRRSVSRTFLCATDRRVLAVVTDEAPPRPLPAFAPDDVEALADLLCARLRLSRGKPRPRERLRVRPTVSRLPAEGSERTEALGRKPRMAKTTNRKGRTSRSRAGRRSGSSRSEAGRKGGNATLRARGPEFYSEIGRKGGKKSGGARSRRAAMARRSGSKRGSSRRTTRRGTRRAPRTSRIR
jgi:molybdopterin-guanine dinucleotide biosynthesis protein B